MKMQWLSALVLGALSCAAFAEEAPADSNLIKQGEYLARAGDCVACHTNGKAGKPFAGGLPMETPIGTIYSTNITPDKEHGIGGYTFEEFDDAVRKGVRKDGSTLYPAKPYRSPHRGRSLFAPMYPTIRATCHAMFPPRKRGAQCFSAPYWVPKRR